MAQLVNPQAGFWRGKSVLLTGHTGFKGAWLALWLSEMGAEVTGLSLPPDDGASPYSGIEAGVGPWTSIYADIRDPEAVAMAYAEAAPDIVLHLAAQALVHASYEDPIGTVATNVVGLAHILDGARRSPGVKAIVNVTSDKCYENIEQIWAYRETDRMGGSDPYSASKGAAELITTAWRRSFFNSPDGPFLASARAGNVIGGGDASPNRLVPDALAAFSRGEPVAIRNPASTRPWQHVLEPLCGYLLLAQALYERGQLVAEGWNFGPPEQDAWPVETVVERLISTWGDGASWATDIRRWTKEASLLRVDPSKARLHLDWAPRLSVGEALDWTVEWRRRVDAGETVRAVTLSQLQRYLSTAARP